MNYKIGNTVVINNEEYIIKEIYSHIKFFRITVYVQDKNNNQFVLGV